MAERRMFAKSIVLSDAFLDMPATARCLYFTLGMFADDDGFVGSPKGIMRQCGASQDDMNILLAKRFLLSFESGVIVIKHWRINNYLQSDRHKDTTYLEELDTLKIDEKGAYTEKQGMYTELEPVDKEKKELTEAQKKRLEAKKESSLPSTFEQQIRNAFVGRKCPICGQLMSYSNNIVKPTIQHNKPISLGGKHELSNISVICASCNTSIQNRAETPPYNTEEVKAVWECIGNVYTGKDSIVKDSIDKNNKGKFTPPTVEEVREYCNERKNNVDPETFVDFYTAKNWYIGKNKVKDWKACVRTWERNRKKNEKPLGYIPGNYDFEELENSIK